MTKFKVFGSYSRARKFAGDYPIIQIGRQYLVASCDLIDLKLTEVSLLDPTGGIVGHITFEHLNRLGNGNYAMPDPKWAHKQIFSAPT